MNISKSLSIWIITSLIISLSACTAVSRKMGELTDNKYAEPRSGTVWVSPPPQLVAPEPENKSVYISFRNISDADIDLTKTIKDAAISQGWTITNNPSKATYRLRSSLRYFGEVEPESGGAGVGASLGAITGAAAGLAIGAATYKATDNAFGAVATGGLVGGMMAAGLANASRPREWALIMDVVLEEKLDKPTSFEMVTSSGSATVDAAGAANSRMASSGSTSNSNQSVATVTKTSNYFPHGIRLSVWANQMNMKEEEALPEIMKRAERVVTQMLPY